MHPTSFCRACLKTSENLVDVSQETMNNFKTSLGIDLRNVKRSKICNNCLKFLDYICDFKIMCLQSEWEMVKFIDKGLEFNHQNEFPLEEEPVDIMNLVDIVKKEFPEDEEMKDIDTLKIEVESDNEDGFEDRKENVELFDVEVELKEEVEKPKKRKYIQNVSIKKQCPVCRKLVRPSWYGRHVKNHRSSGKKKLPVQCSICKKILKSFSLSRHMQKHEVGPCPECDKEIASSHMPIHILTHRDPPVYTEEEKSTYRKNYCETCNNFYASLPQHNSQVHAERLKLTCEMCGEQMTRETLRYHMKKHDIPVECHYCSKKFPLKPQLKKHIQAVHLKILRVHCTVCPKSFTTEGYLRYHMKEHLKIGLPPKFLCSICGHSSPNKRALESHMEAVHIKSGKLKCPHCEARFNTKTAVSYHVDSAHKDKAKSNFGALCVKCVCGLEFFSRTSLRQHTDAEHREPNGNYKCSCGRVYMERNTMYTHYERYHKIPVIAHKRNSKNKKPAT